MTLQGAGIVPSLTNMHAAEELKYLVISGFVIMAVGEMLSGIFAADHKTVSQQFENGNNSSHL
jgi:hypothetical protein